MAYNFLDPMQEQEYLSKAKQAGLSMGSAMAYVNTKKREQLAQQKIGLDIQKQNVESMKTQKDLLELTSGSAGRELPAGEATALSDIKNSLSVLDRLEGTVSQSGEFGIIKGRLGKMNPFDTGAQDVQAQTLQAAQIIGRALEGGKLAEGDIARYQKMLPQITDSPKVAQRKIDNLRATLQEQIQDREEGLQQVGFDVGVPSSTSPGLNLQPGSQIDAPPGTAPALNLKGEIAKYGDVMFNDAKGQFEVYGKENTQNSVFKKTKEGSNIENSFIKFLADSEVLPIVGSIAGGLMGGGLASIGTGAAGAVAGKAMQQGLRELFDPEQQDMTDMARAVVIEGTTDAIMGGLFFGVGAVAGKGLKLVMSNTPGATRVALEGAQAVGKEGIEAAVKEGGEEALQAAPNKRVRDLVARGLKVKPQTEQAKYAASTGGRDIVADIMEKFGIPKSGEALQKAAEEGGEAAGKKLNTLLEGKTASTSEVVDQLKSLQYESLTPGGEFKAGMESASNMLDGYIKEITSYGDEIPLTELNEIKRRMQKSFPMGSGATKSATKLVEQDASTAMKKYIEKFHPEIESTNREKLLSYMAGKIGENLDQKKAGALFNFGDLVLGSANPVLLVGKKGVDMFTGAFNDPLTQARILNEGLELAAAEGNRNAVRNIIRFATRLGITFSANSIQEDPVTGTEPVQSIDQGMEATQPGLGLTQPPAIPMGGGMPGLDLGAYSPEGVPLYR